MNGNGAPRDPTAPSDSDSKSDSDADCNASDYYAPISNSDSDSESPIHEANGNGIATLRLSESDGSDEDDGGDSQSLSPTSGDAFEAVEAERRRRAALPEGAAPRIVDAMRGVEFPGAPPAWALSIPEDDWIERLRRLRQAAPS